MVIEPSLLQLRDMMSKVGTMGGDGDQSFLQAYFTGWLSNTALHLDGAYKHTGRRCR